MAAVLESVMETWIVPVEKQSEKARTHRLPAVYAQPTLLLTDKMRTEVVLRDMSEEGGAADIADVETVVAEEELVLRQYCKLICQICGHEEDMLNRPWRTKVNLLAPICLNCLCHPRRPCRPRQSCISGGSTCGTVCCSTTRGT